MDVVILFETPRLVVRHFVAEDAEALFAIYGNPVVTKWVDDGTPLTYDLCVKWIEVSLHNYQSKGFGASAVVEKSSGQMIGCCGIVYAPDHNEPEIIYGFELRWWGRGYASEVVPPMLNYGLKEYKLARILATIYAENKVSQHIVEKAGMVLEREEHEPDGHVTLVYTIET